MLTPTDSPSPANRFLRKFVDVHPGEGARLLLGALGFFCVLASYFVLKPLREEIGISRGTQNLPWLWSGTLAVTLLLAPLFAWLVTRYPRRIFLPVAYRFFAVNLIVFVVLSRVLQGEALTWMRFGFYFWVSAFNMFIASIWWAFMADLFRLEQSRRLFGCIAVGGTLGAIVGAELTRSLVSVIGPFGLMLCSLAFLEAAAQIARWLAREADPAEELAVRRGVDAPAGSAWNGLLRVAQSPYMRMIGIAILLQTLVVGFLGLEVQQLVHDSTTGAANRTETFAIRELWAQYFTLALQLFVTGRVIHWLGVSATLVIQPFLALAGFTLLAWVLPDPPAPGGGFPADAARLGFALTTAVVLEAVLRASQHAFTRPARETLFTVVDREDKYKAKSVLDTFVLRGGDVAFAWLFRAVRIEAAVPASLAAAAVIPFAGAWLVVGWMLGRRQQTLARER